MDDLQYCKYTLFTRFLISYVLNLVINGWPSIQIDKVTENLYFDDVLNLVINGWPSIQD